MKVNNRLYPVIAATVVLSLFLILTSSTGSAASTISETQITTTGTADSPDIYKDRIVWEDWRDLNHNIYMYDLSTSKVTPITTNPAASENPAIYGNRIVWQDNRNGNWDIYMYDLSTHKETQITKNPGDSENPVIYGNRIVWQDNRSGNWDIYIYDLSTHKETYTTNKSDQINPDIYGNRVVWEDERNGGHDIYIQDLSTNKQIQITTSELAYKPKIYDNRIVWVDQRNRDNIYMYDLSTRKETQISSDGLDPAIYGNKIVWGGYDDWSMRIFDLSTHQETAAQTRGVPWGPAIYGDRVVWVEETNGGDNDDIYMATLNQLVAVFSATPTTGKAPLTVKFTDKSTGSPTSWKWNFGDGKTSTTKSPVHKYTKAGKYTVSLSVKNAFGSNIQKISNYITVK
jgi:beta propeller repeat protein